MTYPIDQVLRGAARFAVWQTPWTGKTYEMRAPGCCRWRQRGESRRWVTPSRSCRTARCRARLIDRIRGRFGDICNSTGPGRRVHVPVLRARRQLPAPGPAAREWSTRPPQRRERLSHRGEDRFRGLQAVSRGSSVARRGAAPGAQPELEHALPRVRARAQGVGDRLPELTLAAYLDGLAWGLPLVEDPARRQAMEEVLVANGWQRHRRACQRGARRVEGCARVWGACVRRHRPLVRLAAAAGAIPEPNGFTFPTEVAGGRVREDQRAAAYPEEPAARSPARGLSAAHAVWVATWL